jgi:hypothetical protein
VKVSQSFLSERTWLFGGVGLGVLVTVGVVVLVGVTVGEVVTVGVLVGV